MKNSIRFLLSVFVVAASWPLAPLNALTLADDSLIAPYVEPVIKAPAQTEGAAKTAFMKLVPSLKCTLGWHTCSPEEIRSARLKVKAYVAAFGIAMLAYGMKRWMDLSKPIQISQPEFVKEEASPGWQEMLRDKKIAEKIAEMKTQIITAAQNAGGSGLYQQKNQTDSLHASLKSLKLGHYPVFGDFTQEEKSYIRNQLKTFVEQILMSKQGLSTSSAY